MNAVVGLIMAWGLHGDPAPQTAVVGSFATDAECHSAVFAKIKENERALIDGGVTRAIVVCVDTTPPGVQSHTPKTTYGSEDDGHPHFRFDFDKITI